MANKEIKKIKLMCMNFIKMKMATMTAKDGTVLEVSDSFVEGAEVYTRNEDGDLVQAPDGTFTWDNGTVIVVEGGIIQSILAEQETTSEPSADAETQVDDAVEAMQEVAKSVMEIVDMVEEVRSEVQTAIDEINLIKTEFAALRREPAPGTSICKNVPDISEGRYSDLERRTNEIKNKIKY